MQLIQAMTRRVHLNHVQLQTCSQGIGRKETLGMRLLTLIENAEIHQTQGRVFQGHIQTQRSVFT